MSARGDRLSADRLRPSGLLLKPVSKLALVPFLFLYGFIYLPKTLYGENIAQRQ